MGEARSIEPEIAMVNL